jgi:uncharacterized protein YndB with AHSA1/START domain
MQDRIEKTIVLKAPRSRVWRALTDHREFGTWFRMVADGPFVAGEVSRGRCVIPGYEHVAWNATIKTIEPQSYFAFTWHPFAVERDYDYDTENPTLVEFTLTETEAGTRLTVVESGFDRIPIGRRAEAFRMNDGGWEAQLKNIAAHVEA